MGEYVCSFGGGIGSAYCRNGAVIVKKTNFASKNVPEKFSLLTGTKCMGYDFIFSKVRVMTITQHASIYGTLTSNFYIDIFLNYFSSIQPLSLCHV